MTTCEICGCEEAGFHYPWCTHPDAPVMRHLLVPQPQEQQPGDAMTQQQRECRHEKFGATVKVNRLEDTGHFMCDVLVGCMDCGVPFSFVGPPMGGLMSGPSVSVDRTELRIPIEPGPTHPGASGEVRFEVPQRARES